MVKVGQVEEAKILLTEQAGLPEASVARQILSAIGELADTDKRTARQLFKVWRPKYRDEILPSSCHQFVRFDLHTVWRDMVPVVDLVPELFTKDEVTKIKVEGQDVFLVTFATTGSVNADYAYVCRDNDAAEAIALERVKDTLKTEPGMFNQDFLERYIDDGKLREEVREMALDRDYVEALKRNEFWRMAEQYGIYDEGEDDDEEGDPPDITDDWIDKLTEAIADERATYPRQYLVDMMGDAEATRWIMDNIPIDIDAAAQAAVNEDGAGQFLSSWDNELHETSSGFVYWLE